MIGWIAAGHADWWCHRVTDIEHTSGFAECIFHWALLAIGGIALVLALMLQPSLGLVVTLFALWLLHQVVTWMELRYVVQLRCVQPTEQMVHSFLEVIPLVLILVISVDIAIHGEPRALIWQFSLRSLSAMEPAPILATYGVAILLLILVPFTEEAIRCYKRPRYL